MNKKQLLLTIAALGALCVPVQAATEAGQMPWAQQDAFWGLNKGQATATGVGAVSLAAAAVMLAMPSVRNSARRAIKAKKNQTIFTPTTTSDYIAAGLIATLTLAGVAALISTPFLGKKAGAASASGAAKGSTAKTVKEDKKSLNDFIQGFKKMTEAERAAARVARMAEYQLYNNADGEEKPGQYFDFEYQTDDEGNRTLKERRDAENFNAEFDDQEFDENGKMMLAERKMPDTAIDMSMGRKEGMIAELITEQEARDAKIAATRKAMRDAKAAKRAAWFAKPENKAADEARKAKEKQAAERKQAHEKRVQDAAKAKPAKAEAKAKVRAEARAALDKTFETLSKGYAKAGYVRDATTGDFTSAEA